MCSLVSIFTEKVTIIIIIIIIYIYIYIYIYLRSASFFFKKKKIFFLFFVFFFPVGEGGSGGSLFPHTTWLSVCVTHHPRLRQNNKKKGGGKRHPSSATPGALHMRTRRQRLHESPNACTRTLTDKQQGTYACIHLSCCKAWALIHSFIFLLFFTAPLRFIFFSPFFLEHTLPGSKTQMNAHTDSRSKRESMAEEKDSGFDETVNMQNGTECTDLLHSSLSFARFDHRQVMPFVSENAGGAANAMSREKTGSGCLTEWVSDDLIALSANLKTIVPKGTWESLGSEKEINEENAYNVRKRPQVRVSFEVSRNILLHQRMTHTSYLTKEASEDCRDLRGAKNNMYGLEKDEVDVGVQAVLPVVNSTSQTRFSRKVDAAVQAEATLFDACIRNIKVPKNESPALTSFFNKVLPRMLHCLQQNHEIPIYEDDFSLFTEDDAIVGSRDDTVLIEKGNYTHTTMKDLCVSSISWRSSRPKDDFACIASIAQNTLEQRIEVDKRCEATTNLVWDFADPMHPRAMLEAPVEVQVLEFNPLLPNLIVGGAMNGQLFLWDLNGISSPLSSGKPGAAPLSTDVSQDHKIVNKTDMGASSIPPMPAIVRGLSMVRDGDVLVPRLQPIQCSRVELSHRRSVHAIQWMPNGLECAFDGKQVVAMEGRQFISLSDDGFMCVWDIRPEHLPSDKLRKMKHQGRIGGDDFPWVPLLRFQMLKPGGGDLMGFRFHVDGLKADGAPSYIVCCGSTNGEVAVCNISTPDEKREFSGNSEGTRVVRHITRGHGGPVYSVQRHPTISDVYMSCGDLSFKLWRVGLNHPIFVSSQHDAPITCARWSPTRVSVIMVGTSDGKILVWDLLDRNREALVVHQLVQDAITVINFKPPPSTLPPHYVQYVAIGTSVGSFHWYALPKVLSRGPSGEQRHFRAMIEREVRRVHYYAWRWAERGRERDRYGPSAPKMMDKARSVAPAAIDTANTSRMPYNGNFFDDNFYACDRSRDMEFLQEVEQPLPDLDVDEDEDN